MGSPRWAYIFPERSIGQDTYRGNPWAPWTQNLYAYAGNNPVNYTDPTGHCFWDACVLEGAGLITIGVALAAFLTPYAIEAGRLIGQRLAEATSGWFAPESAAFPSAPTVTEYPAAEPSTPTIMDYPSVSPSDPVVLDTPAAAPSAPAVLDTPAVVPSGPTVMGTPTNTESGPTIVLQQQTQASGPNFVVTPSGTAIPIPAGATGPVPVASDKGVQYSGGSTVAPNGAVISSVRIMDPTQPSAASPGYPNGYVVYHNQYGQPVDPQTGRTLPRSRWHIAIY